MRRQGLELRPGPTIPAGSEVLPDRPVPGVDETENRRLARLDVWIGWTRLASAAGLVLLCGWHHASQGWGTGYRWLLFACAGVLYGAVWLLVMPSADPRRYRALGWSFLLGDAFAFNAATFLTGLAPEVWIGVWYVLAAQYAVRFDRSVGIAAAAVGVASVLLLSFDGPPRWAAGPPELLPPAAHALALLALGVLLGSIADQDRKLRRELSLMAIRDGLTGLYNYRYFHDVLERELSRAKREGKRVSLLMIDLDNFKELNDTYGHLVGDEVLRETGTLIQECVRFHDSAFRYGGEEFTVLLPGADEHAARVVAERIRTAVAAHSFSQGKVTISIGLSTYPDHAASKEELIRLADRALYTAKESGRNQICP